MRERAWGTRIFKPTVENVTKAMGMQMVKDTPASTMGIDSLKQNENFNRDHRTAQITVQSQVHDQIRERFEIGKRRGRLWGGGQVGLLLQVSMNNYTYKIMNRLRGSEPYDGSYFEVWRRCMEWSFSLHKMRNVRSDIATPREGHFLE